MGTLRRVVLANIYLFSIAILVALFPDPIWIAVWLGSILLYPLGGGMANLGYRHWGDVALVGVVTFAAVTGALIARLDAISAVFGAIFVAMGLVAVNYFAVKWTPDPRVDLTIEARRQRRRKAILGGGAMGFVILVTWTFFAILLSVDFLFRGRWQISPLGFPLLPLLLLGIALMLGAYVSEKQAANAARP